MRPVQISYIDHSYNTQDGSSILKNRLNGVRVQAGLVYNLENLFGRPSKQGAVLALCSAEPPAVTSGKPVKVRVTSQGFLPERKLRYSYSSTGGAISPKRAGLGHM